MKHIAEKLRSFFQGGNRGLNLGILESYVAGKLDMASPNSLDRRLVTGLRESESQEGKSALWQLILEAEDVLEAEVSAEADDIAEIVQILLAFYLLVDGLRPSRFESNMMSRPRLARLLFDAALGQIRYGNVDSAICAFDRAAAYFSAEMPQPPELLATDLAARTLREEQGNNFGAALIPADILPLRKLEESRFTYDQRQHERYLSSIDSIVDVFWRGSLFNAVGRLIASTLSYLHWRAGRGYYSDYIVALNRFAKLALEDGDYATAYKSYGISEKVCEVGNKSDLVPFGRLGRAKALAGLRFYHGATALFNECIEVREDDDLRSEAMVGLSRILLQTGNYDSAIRVHSEWRELTGKDAPEFLCEIEARRLMAAGDKAGALVWLEKSSEAPTGARGEEWGLHRALLAARIKADLKKFEDAHVDLTIALSIARYFFKYSDRPALDALAAEIWLGLGRPDHAELFLLRDCLKTH